MMATNDKSIRGSVSDESPLLSLPALPEHPSDYEIGALEWNAHKLETAAAASLSMMGRLLWTESNALHGVPPEAVSREEIASVMQIMGAVVAAAAEARERAACAIEEAAAEEEQGASYGKN